MAIEPHRLLRCLLVLLAPLCPCGLLGPHPEVAAAETGDGTCRVTIEWAHVLSRQGQETRLYRQIVTFIEQRNGHEVDTRALGMRFADCLQQLQASCAEPSDADEGSDDPCPASLLAVTVRLEGSELVVERGSQRRRLSASGPAWRLARKTTAACSRHLPAAEGRSLSETLWYFWVEATIGLEGQRYDSYTYADQLALRRARRRGKSFIPGVAVAIDGDRGHVREVLDPDLATAGLRAGALVLSIDGEPLAGRLYQLWVRPSPSSYTMTVEQDGARLQLAGRTLPLRHETLRWSRWRGLVYARIDWFARDSLIELRRMARAVAGEPVAGLILDLRGNLGGRTSLGLVDCFLKPGQTVASVIEEPDGERVDVEASIEYYGWPLVVLVDSDTASMAEVLAAAIQVHERGLLVGERTTGKGVGQTVYPIGDEGELSLTESRYLYPGTDTSWQGAGLTPDVTVVADEDERDRLRDQLAQPLLDLERQLEHDRALQRALALITSSSEGSSE